MTHKLNPNNLTPHHDRVLICRDPKETQTKAGIVIPNDSAERPRTGVVISTGPGEIRKDGSIRPLEVSPGERVIFHRAAGSDIEGEDGHTYLLVKEEQILAVIGEESNP